MLPFLQNGEHHDLFLATAGLQAMISVSPLASVPVAALIASLTVENQRVVMHCIFQKLDDANLPWVGRLRNGVHPPAFGGLVATSPQDPVFVISMVSVPGITRLPTTRLVLPIAYVPPPAVPAVPAAPARTTPSERILVQAQAPLKDFESQYLGLLLMNSHHSADLENGKLLKQSKFSDGLLNWVHNLTPVSWELSPLFTQKQLWKNIILWRWADKSNMSDTKESRSNLADVIPEAMVDPDVFKVKFVNIAMFLDATFRLPQLWEDLFSSWVKAVDARIGETEHKRVKASYYQTLFNKILTKFAVEVNVDTFYNGSMEEQDLLIDNFIDKYLAEHDVKEDFKREVGLKDAELKAQEAVRQSIAAASLSGGKRNADGTANNAGGGGGGSGGGGKKSKNLPAGSKTSTSNPSSPGKQPVCVFLALHAAGDPKTTRTCIKANCTFDHGTDRSAMSKTEAMKGFTSYLKSSFFKRKREVNSLLTLLQAWVNGPGNFGLP